MGDLNIGHENEFQEMFYVNSYELRETESDELYDNLILFGNDAIFDPANPEHRYPNWSIPCLALVGRAIRTENCKHNYVLLFGNVMQLDPTLKRKTILRMSPPNIVFVGKMCLLPICPKKIIKILAGPIYRLNHDDCLNLFGFKINNSLSLNQLDDDYKQRQIFCIQYYSQCYSQNLSCYKTVLFGSLYQSDPLNYGIYKVNPFDERHIFIGIATNPLHHGSNLTVFGKLVQVDLSKLFHRIMWPNKPEKILICQNRPADYSNDKTDYENTVTFFGGQIISLHDPESSPKPGPSTSFRTREPRYFRTNSSESNWILPSPVYLPGCTFNSMASSNSLDRRQCEPQFIWDDYDCHFKTPSKHNVPQFVREVDLDPKYLPNSLSELRDYLSRKVSQHQKICVESTILPKSTDTNKIMSSTIIDLSYKSVDRETENQEQIETMPLNESPSLLLDLSNDIPNFQNLQLFNRYPKRRTCCHRYLAMFGIRCKCVISEAVLYGIAILIFAFIILYLTLIILRYFIIYT